MAWFSACIAFLHHGGWIWLALALAAGAAGLGVYDAIFRARGGVGPQRGFAGKSGRAEARRQWLRRLADASFDGLLVHRNGTILQMNRALVRMLGYREAELLGTAFSNLASPTQVAGLRTELEAPQPQIAEFTLLHADKSERFVEMVSHTLQLDGRPVTVTAIRDVTAMRELQAKLVDLTRNDRLTGLPNRETFIERLQAAVARNDSAGGTTAVLMLELAQLQAVNDQLGRAGGDNLLRQLALRLQGLLQEGDTLARLGGKRFAIAQPHLGAPNRTALLASRIEIAMENAFIIDTRPIRVGLAIGIAIYPEHATGPDGLIDASLFALRKAVETGGAQMFSHAEAIAAGFGDAGGSARRNPSLTISPMGSLSTAYPPTASPPTASPPTASPPMVVPQAASPQTNGPVKPSLVATQR